MLLSPRSTGTCSTTARGAVIRERVLVCHRRARIGAYRDRGPQAGSAKTAMAEPACCLEAELRCEAEHQRRGHGLWLLENASIAVNDPVRTMPSRFKVAKPGSVNVTVQVPGRRSSIRYRPFPSDTALRTFSMSTERRGRSAAEASAPATSIRVAVPAALSSAPLLMRSPVRDSKSVAPLLPR